jgi:hypothetical protein
MGGGRGVPRFVCSEPEKTGGAQRGQNQVIKHHVLVDVRKGRSAQRRKKGTNNSTSP